MPTWKRIDFEEKTEHTIPEGSPVAILVESRFAEKRGEILPNHNHSKELISDLLADNPTLYSVSKLH